MSQFVKHLGTHERSGIRTHEGNPLRFTFKTR